jgi:hypothetical protein
LDAVLGAASEFDLGQLMFDCVQKHSSVIDNLRLRLRRFQCRNYLARPYNPI